MNDFFDDEYDDNNNPYYYKFDDYDVFINDYKINKSLMKTSYEKLIDYIKEGNLEEIKKFPTLVNDIKYKNNIAFKEAILYGQSDIIKYFIEISNLDISIMNDLFQLVCQMDNIDIVKLFIEIDKDKQFDYKIAFKFASEISNIEIIKLFIEPNLISQCDKNYALKYNCFTGNENIVIYLLDNGASIPDNEEVLLATNGGHLNIIKILLERGVQIDTLFNCLYKAVISKKFDIAKYFISIGVDIHSNDNNIFYDCIKYEKYEQLSFLFKNGVDINLDNSNGLIYSIHRGQLRNIIFLLENGADIYNVSSEIINYCIYNEKFKTFNTLVDYNLNFSYFKKDQIFLLKEKCPTIYHKIKHKMVIYSYNQHIELVYN